MGLSLLPSARLEVSKAEIQIGQFSQTLNLDMDGLSLADLKMGPNSAI